MNRAQPTAPNRASSTARQGDIAAGRIRWHKLWGQFWLVCTLCLASLAASPARAGWTVDPFAGLSSDDVTGLMWDRCIYGRSGRGCPTGSPQLTDWPGALAVAVAANAQGYKGYHDWRLPNITELESLVLDVKTPPVIYTYAFPGTPTSGAYLDKGAVWSSTSYAPVPGNILVVDFGVGEIYSQLSSDPSSPQLAYVRLVRGGPSGAAFDLLAPAPTLSALGISAITTSGSTLNASSDIDANGYFVVLPSGANAPSAAQVYDGLNASGGSPVAAGSGTMTAGAAVAFPISGLSAATAYDVYVVAAGAGPLSSLGGPLTFTTLKNSQSISDFVASPGAPVYAPNGSFTVSANASSGLTVSFSSTSASVCTVTGNTVSIQSAGDCKLTADQAGDASYDPAPQLTLTVSIGLATQASLSASANPTSFALGASSTLSAIGGSGTGSVSFQVISGPCTVNSTTLTASAAGSCQVTATKDSDGNYAAVTTAAITVSVTAASSDTTLVSSANPSAYLKLTTLTAVVTPLSGNPPPTGTVSFSDASTVLCADVALVAGGVNSQAHCVAPNLKVGAHSLQASYSGDANHLASTGALTQTVTPVRTVSGPVPGGTGSITATLSGPDDCSFASYAFQALPTGTSSPPPGYTLPFGVFQFSTNDQCGSSPFGLTLTYPGPLPGTAQYYKFGPTADDASNHWYPMPDLTVSGNRISFAILDGELGDDDLTANGVIVDAGGLALPVSETGGGSGVAPIPTLGEAALPLLALLVGWLGWFGLRAGSARRRRG